MRTVDAEADTLEVDFHLHDTDGAGVQWAASARPGTVLGLLGPGAHGPKSVTWNVYVGDETGLPGIARMIEAPPQNAKGIALITVANEDKKQTITAPEGVDACWFYREIACPSANDRLMKTFRRILWLENHGESFFWCGCEYTTFRDARRYLRETINLPKTRQVAFAYRRRSLSNDEIIEAGGDVVSE